MTPRARKVTLTTIVGAIAFALASSATAYFSTIGSGAGSASTATLNAPGTPSFVQMNESSVDISWTAPVNSAPVSHYRVFRTGAATFVCQATAPALTCSDGSITPSTTYTYTVTAYAGSWTSTSPAAEFTTATPAAAPGAPVITFPTATSYTTTASWNAGCTPIPGFCGTASPPDGQALSKVQFSLKQGTTWWNGTDFTSATEQYFDMSGTTAWTQAFAFPPVGSYVLNVKAIDGRSVESAVASVTFSVGAPTSDAATSTTLSSSDLVSVTGQSVTYTATVAATTGTPSGTVSFTEGATTVCADVALSSGTATCTPPTYTSIGTHPIVAVFTPGAGFTGSTSATLTQEVDNAAVTGLIFTSVTLGTSSVTPTCSGAFGTANYVCTVSAPSNNTKISAFVAFSATSGGAPIALASVDKTVSIVYIGKGAPESGATSLTIGAGATTTSVAAFTTENGNNIAEIKVTVTSPAGGTWTAVLRTTA